MDKFELEKILSEDRKESEARLNKNIDQILSLIEQQNEKIDSKLGKLEDKIDGNNKWIMGVCLTTILSIAAMVISILLK